MMNKRIFSILAIILAVCSSVVAQENFFDKFTFGGFIQTDFEYNQYEGKSNNGGYHFYSADRDGADNDYFLRYGVRRGGMGLEYNDGKVKGVFQADWNDGGMYVKGASIMYSPADWIGINAGIQTVWFGEEANYPPLKQEVLEHCDLFRNLFYLDRDLGLKITLYAPKNTKFDGLKLDIGFVSGNNINQVPDGKMNVVGHLKYTAKINKVYASVGSSFYAGHTNNASNTWAYYMLDSLWVKDKPANEKNLRYYYGIDAQVKFPTRLGMTELKTEWAGGFQPSQLYSFRSPDNNEYDPENPFFIERQFFGGYVYAFQDLGKTFRLLLKYTLMNPNIASKKEYYMSSSDITVQTFGIGLQYRVYKGLNLTALFDINKNETFEDIPAYNYDRKDNRFTLRLQYDF